MSNNVRAMQFPVSKQRRKDVHFVGTQDGVDVWCAFELVDGEYWPGDLIYTGAHSGSTCVAASRDPHYLWSHLVGLKGFSLVADVVHRFSDELVEMNVFVTKKFPSWWRPYQPHLE